MSTPNSPAQLFERIAEDHLRGHWKDYEELPELYQGLLRLISVEAIQRGMTDTKFCGLAGLVLILWADCLKQNLEANMTTMLKRGYLSPSNLETIVAVATKLQAISAVLATLKTIPPDETSPLAD